MRVVESVLIDSAGLVVVVALINLGIVRRRDWRHQRTRRRR
jgi:hypothetical protein